MKQLLLKHAAVIILLCVCSLTGIAQNNKVAENLIYSRQLRFSFSPLLYDNLKINNQGEELLKSRPTFSGEATISYYQHLKNGYGINIGAGLGLASFNVNYYFKAPENSIFRTGIFKDDYEFLDANFYEYFSMTYVFPIYLSKMFEYKGKLISIGVGIKYYSLLDKTFEMSGGHTFYIDEDNTRVRLFKFYLEDTGRKHLFSYFIKLGIIKMTKKQNTFHINLVANYSPYKLGNGWYRFENLPYESYGTIEQNINYIGFEFTYGLTLLKRLKDKKND